MREALVNAVAHRNHEDRTRKILVRVFSDRVEIASPGYAPQPLTLAKLRKGGYRPCSSNPLIAQTLATLGVMEQRGSGFARMREAMLNHGLAEPEIAQQVPQAVSDNVRYCESGLAGPCRTACP